jgi:hypothetical protein
MNVLEVMYEYLLLLDRQTLPDMSPADSERARLVGLGRLLRGDYPSGELKRVRVQNPMPVQFTVPGGFAVGAMRGVTARGMVVVTTRCPQVGTRTMVRVPDSDTGIEYVFPGRVSWSRGRLMGVAFDGLPTKTDPFAPSSAPWGRDLLRLGPARQAPMVA